MYSYEPTHVLWPCLSMTQFFFSADGQKYWRCSWLRGRSRVYAVHLESPRGQGWAGGLSLRGVWPGGRVRRELIFNMNPCLFCTDIIIWHVYMYVLLWCCYRVHDSADVFDNKGLPNSNSAESNFLSGMCVLCITYTYVHKVCDITTLYLPNLTSLSLSLSLSLSFSHSLSLSSSPAAEDHIPRRAPSPQLAHHWEVESKRLSSGSTPSPRATKKKARPRSMAFLIEPNQTFEPVKKEATPSQPLQRRSKCCLSGTDILGGRRVGNFQGIQLS